MIAEFIKRVPASEKPIKAYLVEMKRKRGEARPGEPQRRGAPLLRPCSTASMC